MVKKRGRQTPTRSAILPYTETKGDDAARLYEQSGRKAIEWQSRLIRDAMALDDAGLWAHQKFGFSLPRRNGKSEVVVMRELWGLSAGEKICHTAHRTTTSSGAFECLLDVLASAGYEDIGRTSIDDVPEGKRAYKMTRQNGRESIRMAHGGEIVFRTRTPSGGLGEGFDLLVIDEAQEYTEAQASALKYTVSDSRNPQTLFCGTPPTAVSAGTVFPKMRESALAGRAYQTGWAEWSIQSMTKAVHDTALWYETNPSMGYHLDERKIEAEIGPDLTDFNIQRLGVWISYSQTSAISAEEWAAVRLEEPPKPEGGLYVGIKFGPDARRVAVSLAVRVQGRRIFVECLGCRPVRDGTDWIIDLLRRLNPERVAIDGANGQRMLATAMRDARLRRPMLPTVKEVIAANAAFEQGIFGKTLAHGGQSALTRIVTYAEHRPIGSSGGFGYRVELEGDEEAEVALIDSTALAYWLCEEKTKERRRSKSTC